MQSYRSVTPTHLMQCDAIWKASLVLGVAYALGGFSSCICTLQGGIHGTEWHYIHDSVHSVAFAWIGHAFSVGVTIVGCRASATLLRDVENLGGKAHRLHRYSQITAGEQTTCCAPLE